MKYNDNDNKYTTIVNMSTAAGYEVISHLFQNENINDYIWLNILCLVFQVSYRVSVLPRILIVVVGFYIAFSTVYPVYT